MKSILQEYTDVIEDSLVQAGLIISRKYSYSVAKSGNRKPSIINSIYVDDENQKVVFAKTFFNGVFEVKKNLKSEVKIYNYKDINDFELKEDGQTIISGTAGNALIGGILFGGVGAVAGASGKRTATTECTSSKLIIYINDLQNPTFIFSIVTPLYTLCETAKDTVVREILGLLTFIKKQPEKDVSNSFDVDKYNKLYRQYLFEEQKQPEKKKKIKHVTEQKEIIQKLPNSKNKWITFFLCLFLGWLGMHRFYEKKFITGILYMFTMGMFFIGVLVDLIIILTKPKYYTSN